MEEGCFQIHFPLIDISEHQNVLVAEIMELYQLLKGINDTAVGETVFVQNVPLLQNDNELWRLKLLLEGSRDCFKIITVLGY